MKTIQTVFTLSALLLTIWQCTTPEPQAMPWHSFIPEGYTLRDSVRGDLNLDSVPDFLLVLDSIAPPEVAPPRPVLLLYGVAGGKFKLADSNNALLYDLHSGGVSSVEPYTGTTIDSGRFTIEQEGGMPGFHWNLTLRFALDSTDKLWYLDRSAFTTSNPEDTLPMRVTEKVVVHDRNDFGKVTLNSFNIENFEPDEADTTAADDRFIRFNFFKMRPLILPAQANNLDSVAALRALFPGRFLRDFEFTEDANVVFWICDACPKVKLDWFDLFDKNGKPEKTDFPESFANFTEVAGTLDYEEGGEQYKAVFFSTSFDYPGSGRFSPGILGMAIFKKVADSWQLTTFSPHVAAEGSFETARAPQSVLIANNQTFFVLDGGNANGVGASYNYYHLFIFGLLRDVPVVLFHDPDSACSPNGVKGNPTNWTSELEVIPGKSDFPDLMLKTNGHYQEDEEMQDIWEDTQWLKKQIQQHPGQDSFDFKVERRFRFNGKKYVPVR